MRGPAFVLLLLTAASIDAQYTQQGSKLRAIDGTGPALGTSVAISHDGNTAVAGGPEDRSQTGAAWIFTRNGSIWSQQGPRLVAGDATASARQGTSVAISADGNTVLVGGANDAGGLGAAWVFTRTAGVWTQQGAKIVGTGAVGNSAQGSAVALSADGNTAIIGGPSDNSSVGAAWIFTRSGGTWTQQGSKVVGVTLSGASNQGFAVALSGDGDTAIIGGPSGADAGAVWIFTRTEGVWTQQGGKLIGVGGVGGILSVRHGTSVALSYDGNTAIAGGPGDTSERGAVWVYIRTAGEWAQQGPKLFGATSGRQGWSVALSADGNTAVSGAYLDHPDGAVWVFTRDELGVWTQLGTKLVGTGASPNTGFQGQAVAISGNATTIIEAGSNDSSLTGSVWPFATSTATIATRSGDGQSAQTNAAFAPLSVIVRDAAGEPSADVSVTFAVDPGPSGATGTFASSATVITNAEGIATAPTLTANGTIGGFTITATTPAAPAPATFNLANAAFASPTNVVATGNAGLTSIAVTWTAVSGATQYEVVHAQDAVTYTTRTTMSDTSFVDSSAIGSNSAYLYKVRVTQPQVSGFSAPDLAVVVSFTDAALAGVAIKATHVTQLRQAVHVVRALSGLDAPAYTDSDVAGVTIKAAHITELRAALDEARTRILLPTMLYTRPTITPGSTVIAATDVLELRSGVQ